MAMQLLDPDHRMPSPSLDLDVVDIICAFLTEYPDLLSLSLTCSVLRPIAIRNILKIRPIVLKNVDSICKFHNFVFSDPAVRLHLITSLRVDVAFNHYYPESGERARAIDCLVAIIERAPSLTCLELHPFARGSSLGYLDDPRLAAVVSSLTTLQELTVGGQAALDFVGPVRSPLKKLSVASMRTADDVELSSASLCTKLFNVAHSLECLSILYSPIRLLPAQTPPYRVSTPTQFHALRSLTLRGPAGPLRIHVLLDLFPNLDGTLNLTGFPQEANGFEDVAIRELNGAAQAQRSWKRLERLICRDRMLFLLNVRCPIGVIIVHSYSASELDGSPSPYLVEALRGSPPTRLNVEVQLSFREPQDVPLSGMIPPEAAGVLTHLTLCVKYRYRDPEEPEHAVRWEDLWRDKLRPLFLDLRALTHLRFIFHCEAWVNHEENEVTPVRDGTVFGDLLPAAFDFAAVTHSIADAVPPLRYCFLTTGAQVFESLNIAMYDIAEHWRESRAWRIATSGCADGNRTLVELHEDVAEAILANEGLDLTEEEGSFFHPTEIHTDSVSLLIDLPSNNIPGQVMQPFDPNPRMTSLDLDTLDIICAFLTGYPDLLSFSLTSSVLRPIAIRNMLRNRPVVLKNVNAICKFHDFVFSDPATRLHLITSLIIDVAHNATHPKGSERAIDCLLATLKRVPSLTSLGLNPSAFGQRLGYLDDPRLAAVVSSLTTLQELTIGGRAAVNFIGTVRSPLKKLSVGFMDDVELSSASLGTKLSHVADSLESLSILYSPVRLLPEWGSPYHLSTQTQFHALRSLTLSGPAGDVRIHALLDLFPNLDGTLHLTGFPEEVDGPNDGFQLPPYESYRSIRELNGAAQAQRSWKRLERLICRERMFFLLNVRCPIGVTTVHSYWPNLNGTPSPYLVEALRGCPPTRLNVQLRLSFREPQEVPLSGMIPPEAAGALTHLTLCVKGQFKDPEHGPAVRWDGLWRDKLRPILLDLRALTHLRFVFYCEAWRSGGEKEVSPVRSDTVLGDLLPATFDFTSVARSIADAIPSLRYCFLTTGAQVFAVLNIATYNTANHWRESRAWRIATYGDADGGATGGNGNSTLVELHADVAETIIAKEGLGLTTEEENEMQWR